MNHTKEPWVISSSLIVCNEDADVIATCTPNFGLSTLDMLACKANAQRIVDCVNACEGIEDPKEWIKNAKEIPKTLA